MLTLRYIVKSTGCEHIPLDEERVFYGYLYRDGFYYEACSEKKVDIIKSLEQIRKQLGVEI